MNFEFQPKWVGALDKTKMTVLYVQNPFDGGGGDDIQYFNRTISISCSKDGLFEFRFNASRTNHHAMQCDIEKWLLEENF